MDINWTNIILLFIISWIVMVDSRPHNHVHKVHSLLLYPNKHAWCETKDIEMVITHPGCQSMTFSNKVCVGQCFSYVTPRTNPPDQMEEKLKYCDQCKPSNTTWKQVTLQCEENVKFKSFTKDVELIHECNCQSCNPAPQSTNEVSEDTELNFNLEYEEDSTGNEQIHYGVDSDGNVMSRKQYLELARHRLESEDHGVIASSEEVEKNKKHGKNWLERRSRNTE